MSTATLNHAQMGADSHGAGEPSFRGGRYRLAPARHLHERGMMDGRRLRVPRIVFLPLKLGRRFGVGLFPQVGWGCNPNDLAEQRRLILAGVDPLAAAQLASIDTAQHPPGDQSEPPESYSSEPLRLPVAVEANHAAERVEDVRFVVGEIRNE